MDIVIMPGLDGTGALVSRAKELLSAEHDVFVLQYPSHSVRYEDLRHWIKDVLPQNDFIIVAESFSGPLAIMATADRPTGLKGIVFVASFAKSPSRFPSFLTRLVKYLPTSSILFSRLLQPVLMGRWSSREFTQQFRGVLAQVPASTIAGRLKQVLSVDVVTQLNSINVPFHYLRAAKDRLVPPRMARDFRRFSNSVIEVDGPHFLLQANPQAAASHISDFAAELKDNDRVDDGTQGGDKGEDCEDEGSIEPNADRSEDK